MKITIIGGGAWGTTLAQVLHDNNHNPLIFDINEFYVNTINNRHVHPIFDAKLDDSISATTDIKKAISHSNYYIIALPTKYIRYELRKINTMLITPSVFINVSKGIEPESLKTVGNIVAEEIDAANLKGYVVLSGPSHAEDLILRRITLLVCASKDNTLAIETQQLFSNDSYLRVYHSSDVIGAEFGGATKNAISVVSGILTGLQMGENARAALITRGILEVVRVVVAMGGEEKTAFGLTGIGDLIVTASSENSRNFKGGKRLGQGFTVEEIESDSKQTIEGFRSIEALHNLSISHDLDLPIINSAYEVIFEKKDALSAIKDLLNRQLKSEN